MNKKKMNTGYLQAVPRPTQDELNEFYKNIYFGEGVSKTYSQNYDEAEILQKRLRADCVVELISQNGRFGPATRFLEIGCGEGFLLSSASAKDWDVVGVDYQSEPAKKFNPNVSSKVIATDPGAYLEGLISEGERKDVIALQNVLEHVLEPENLLRALQSILNDDGCLYVQVPNDYSNFQFYAKKQTRISDEYWFSPPQHLNYFNSGNIVDFAESCGFSVTDGITDFPIELYLWGDEKNYTQDKSKGRYAHRARVELDLFFSENGMDKYLQFYRGAFQIGVGRNICVVLKKAKR
jgi:2-polyprenyl-3-methyl-5-hydroxy-6-metoxy-1,4-benzoquinol methylase